ncbi:PLP-dependent aminotransferase family protein [Reinekea thalattae]|nr:PLP-dependent aminotransferase family protein [Reinekea thalattae]
MLPAQRMASVQPSYIRNILKATQGNNVMSLAGGLPDERLFPTRLLDNAARELDQNIEVYQYGLTRGLPALVEHLCAENNLPSDEQLLITTGSQQGLDLICRAYLNPDDRVLAEAPVYLGALQAFQLAQAKVGLIDATSKGPDLDQLEAKLAKGCVKFFYAVPDFHNPTGTCWSKATRIAVAELLDRYEVALIEDVPYRQLRYSGEHLPLVSSLMKGDFFLLNSFSKIATSGMRLGCVQATKKLLQPLITIKQASDLHTALPMQQMLLSLLQAPEFEGHIASLRHHYGQRAQALANALISQIGGRLTFNEVEGGMFLWARINCVNAVSLAQECLKNDLAVVPGQAFWPEGKAGYQAIRLNFTRLAPADLEKAVGRLSSAMSAL